VTLKPIHCDQKVERRTSEWAISYPEVPVNDGAEKLAARLQKRLRQLELPSYRDYLARLSKDNSGAELTILLDPFGFSASRCRFLH